jgi:Right handed beta helix region
MVRRFALVLSVVLVGLGVPAVQASATSLPPLSCSGEYTLTASARLTHDVSCDVVADSPSGVPITLDLNGHTLTGSATSFSEGLFTIRDGKVVGPIGDLHDSSSSISVTRVIVHGSVNGAGETTFTVTRSIVDGLVTAWGFTDTITDNVLRGGISLDDTMNGQDVTITRNLIVGSPGDGISYLFLPSFKDDVGGTIADNVIARSAGNGINFFDEVTNLGAFSISGNLLVANGGDGIKIDGTGSFPVPYVGGPLTLTRNLAIANAGHGIDATWLPNAPTGIVDGGKNFAFANQTAPQCVAISC